LFSYSTPINLLTSFLIPRFPQGNCGCMRLRQHEKFTRRTETIKARETHTYSYTDIEAYIDRYFVVICVLSLCLTVVSLQWINAHYCNRDSLRKTSHWLPPTRTTRSVTQTDAQMSLLLMLTHKFCLLR